MSPHDLLQSFDDLAPEPDDFRSEVFDGLSERPKVLPCKYFYDAKGSQLFDEICELKEYYPTRTEIALLNEISGDLARHIGPHAHIIEYGCGSVKKVRPLLDALDRPAAYVAVDISREHLLEAARTLAADYPDIDVHAVCADFTKPFKVRPPLHRPNARRVGFFPGSTLGNFRPEDARRFLTHAAAFLGPGGAMVIGVTRHDLRAQPTPEDFHDALALLDRILPVFTLDAREPAQVRTLLGTLIAMVEARAVGHRGNAAQGQGAIA